MLPDGRSIVETWRFCIMERGDLDMHTVARVVRVDHFENEIDTLLSEGNGRR